MAEHAFSYDSVADRYAEFVDTAPYNAHYERPAMLAMFDRLAEGMAGCRVLDAGCGTGWYAQQLLDRGAIVAGVDQSRQMLSYARKRVRVAEGHAPGLAAADLSRGLPFPSSHFHVIISPLVMHYLRDWTLALREFVRVLVPGGRLLFSTHHPSHEAQRLVAGGYPVRYDEVQLVDEVWESIGRVQFFRRSLTHITDALNAAGFLIERIVEPVPTPGFREVKPESYERLLQRPEFLIVQARRE